MKNIEYIYASVAICFWGASAALCKLVVSDIGNFQVMFVTLLIASIILFIINLMTGDIKALREYSIKQLVEMSLIGFVGIFLYQFFFNYGMANMAAQQAFIINYLWPSFLVVFACVILKEKMTAYKMFALILAFLGVVASTTHFDFMAFDFSYPLAIFSSLMAAISYGLYSVFVKIKKYNVFSSMLVYCIEGCILSGICLFMFDEWTPICFKTMAGLTAMAIGPYALAGVYWVKALEKGNTAIISNMAYLTPFISLIYIYFMLGEVISVWSFIGLVMIVGGIMIQLIKEYRDIKNCQA